MTNCLYIVTFLFTGIDYEPETYNVNTITCVAQALLCFSDLNSGHDCLIRFFLSLELLSAGAYEPLKVVKERPTTLERHSLKYLTFVTM